MSAGFEIQLIAVLVAAACALPGVFLVLRRMSMMSDSITHTILLGIVLAFFLVHDLSSPLLIVGAALVGVATVWLTELVGRTRLVSEDSAIGIVFPLLFSIAVILITRYAGSVHLDTDSVLLGELAFAPFDRLVVAGVDLGAKAVWIAGVLLVLNAVLIALFFKELKVATFDPMLAAVLGISPALVHYGLMTMVSLTAVGAFQAVGSVLVVAFMIAPPVTAYLLTDDLKAMLLISAGIGALSGVAGYQLAALWDVSIAGCMAVVSGIVFLLVFVFAPRRGLINAVLRRRRQRVDFAQSTLLLHLYHQGGDGANTEAERVDDVCGQLRWNRQHLLRMAERLRRTGRVEMAGDALWLTGDGALAAEEAERALFAGR